jgi:hypothetical protein
MLHFITIALTVTTTATAARQDQRLLLQLVE